MATFGGDSGGGDMSNFPLVAAPSVPPAPPAPLAPLAPSAPTAVHVEAAMGSIMPSIAVETTIQGEPLVVRSAGNDMNAGSSASASATMMGGGGGGGDGSDRNDPLAAEIASLDRALQAEEAAAAAATSSSSSSSLASLMMFSPSSLSSSSSSASASVLFLDAMPTRADDLLQRFHDALHGLGARWFAHDMTEQAVRDALASIDQILASAALPSAARGLGSSSSGAGPANSSKTVADLQREASQASAFEQLHAVPRATLEHLMRVRVEAARLSEKRETNEVLRALERVRAFALQLAALRAWHTMERRSMEAAASAARATVTQDVSARYDAMVRPALRKAIEALDMVAAHLARLEDRDAFVAAVAPQTREALREALQIVTAGIDRGGLVAARSGSALLEAEASSRKARSRARRAVDERMKAAPTMADLDRVLRDARAAAMVVDDLRASTSSDAVTRAVAFLASIADGMEAFDQRRADEARTARRVATSKAADDDDDDDDARVDLYGGGDVTDDDSDDDSDDDASADDDDDAGAVRLPFGASVDATLRRGGAAAVLFGGGHDVKGPKKGPKKGPSRSLRSLSPAVVERLTSILRMVHDAETQIGRREDILAEEEARLLSVVEDELTRAEAGLTKMALERLEDYASAFSVVAATSTSARGASAEQEEESLMLSRLRETEALLTKQLMELSMSHGLGTPRQPLEVCLEALNVTFEQRDKAFQTDLFQFAAEILKSALDTLLQAFRAPSSS